MDKDLRTQYTRIGKCVEETGRMLASKKKSYWSLEDTQIAEKTLLDCVEALQITNQIRFSRLEESRESS
jgi:hypothetical protein